MTINEASNSHLIWIDLEMTGLDPEVDEIIEIATIITDKELNIIAEGPCLVINQPDSRFERMDEWNQNQHTKSGLWQKVLESKISCEDAENQTIEFLKQYVNPNTCPLAGNSVWQDRRFISKYMKNLDGFLHYRLVDVSTIKEVNSRWYGDKFAYTAKSNNHRALDDIKDSIEELRYYRENLFIATK